jgi:hypothetical protein
VALTGVDVNGSVGVFAVTVDDVFALEGVVLFERLVRSKSIGVDSERLLLAARQQESDRRFIDGLCRHHVPPVGATIDENNHWWLVFLVGTTPTRGKAPRARQTVALATFLSSSDVYLVDFDRADEIEGRRIERFSEALNALVDRFVRDVDF